MKFKKRDTIFSSILYLLHKHTYIVRRATDFKRWDIFVDSALPGWDIALPKIVETTAKPHPPPSNQFPPPSPAAPKGQHHRIRLSNTRSDDKKQRAGPASEVENPAAASVRRKEDPCSGEPAAEAEEQQHRRQPNDKGQWVFEIWNLSPYSFNPRSTNNHRTCELTRHHRQIIQ